MAILQDLIQQIEDPKLRERIMQEVDKALKQKKFGLVFEEHIQMGRRTNGTSIL